MKFSVDFEIIAVFLVLPIHGYSKNEESSEKIETRKDKIPLITLQ
jgi:hypothetical protein